MSDYRHQVAAAVEATTITSPTTFVWFGTRANRPAPAARHGLTTACARRYLLTSLQNTLYHAFYCSGGPVPLDRRAAVPALNRTPFAAALSAANMGSGYWDGGWEVCAIDGPQVIVRRGQLTVWAQVGDCLVDRASTLTPGARVRLRRSNELPQVSPGFYLALGDVPLALDGEQLVRIYWHLRAHVAVPFVADATRQLNQLGLPYRLKVQKEPAGYTRCDSAVLYLRRRDYLLARGLLERLYAALGSELGVTTPALTKVLAPGLGLAEDPGSDESFGMHRCQLLAEGLIRAYEQGRRALRKRVQTVLGCFDEAGIDIDTPYLSPGSNDSYPFRAPPSLRVAATADTCLEARAPDHPTTFLRTAEQLGQLLAKRAVWHAGCCNWLGKSTGHDQIKGNGRDTVYQALGPNLYQGTSGIGLFLSQLAAATGDEELRRTALGAMSHALRRVDAVPPIDRLGLYTGWVGIALAAAHAGLALGAHALLDDARALLRRTARELPEVYEFDLLAGSAGAVAGLAAVHDLLGDSWLLAFAAQLGDGLLQAAVAAPAGASWRSVRPSKGLHLTGFAHGAAGIGYALLELYRKTGEDRYRSAADGAFGYERAWFDATEQNWADLRHTPRRARPLVFAHTWCNGAPGIAVSRLRAYELLGDCTAKLEALAALQTTQRATERMLQTGATDFSLCHGLAGNAAILGYGRRVLGPAWTMSDQVIAEVGKAGRAPYCSGDEQLWVTDRRDDAPPGLMLGLAGLGTFYLGLANPSLPLFLTLADRSA